MFGLAVEFYIKIIITRFAVYYTEIFGDLFDKGRYVLYKNKYITRSAVMRQNQVFNDQVLI